MWTRTYYQLHVYLKRLKKYQYFNMILKFSDYMKSINMSKKTTSVTSLHSQITTACNIILTSFQKSRITSHGTTHIISRKSNNTMLQWTTRTNVNISQRTIKTSTGGLFTTETVISSNGMYSFFNIYDEQKLMPYI